MSNTLKMKYFCHQTYEIWRFLYKVNMFDISKIDIFGKIASGNTSFYWNNTKRCSDHNWGSKDQYITKQKKNKVCFPGKWIFNTSK